MSCRTSLSNNTNNVVGTAYDNPPSNAETAAFCPAKTAKSAATTAISAYCVRATRIISEMTGFTENATEDF